MWVVYSALRQHRYAGPATSTDENTCRCSPVWRKIPKTVFLTWCNWGSVTTDPNRRKWKQVDRSRSSTNSWFTVAHLALPTSWPENVLCAASSTVQNTQLYWLIALSRNSAEREERNRLMVFWETREQNGRIVHLVGGSYRPVWSLSVRFFTQSNRSSSKINHDTQISFTGSSMKPENIARSWRNQNCWVEQVNESVRRSSHSFIAMYDSYEDEFTSTFRRANRFHRSAPALSGSWDVSTLAVTELQLTRWHANIRKGRREFGFVLWEVVSADPCQHDQVLWDRKFVIIHNANHTIAHKTFPLHWLHKTWNFLFCITTKFSDMILFQQNCTMRRRFPRQIKTFIANETITDSRLKKKWLRTTIFVQRKDHQRIVSHKQYKPISRWRKTITTSDLSFQT